MSRVLSVTKSGFSVSGRTREAKKQAVLNGSILCFKKGSPREFHRFLERKGSARISFMGIIIILVVVIIISGAFYLYQVNDLANRGYEMKKVENDIQELKKINEGNKIKEVELKSMYNLEKTTQDLNMVNSNDISYLKIKGPVAMK